MAAMQDSAVANLKSLDELLRWVGKRSGARGVAGQVSAKNLNSKDPHYSIFLLKAFCHNPQSLPVIDYI